MAVLGLFAAFEAKACLNEYRPNTAAVERSRSAEEKLTLHSHSEPWPERRNRLRQLLAEGGDFRVKNDLAAALAHTGEAKEAVKLLEEIEAEKPGLYFTAANLGTAYELSGDNQKALEWIREGIKRNPDAHEGTEWLHVLILQYKMAIDEDAKWPETHTIFGDPVFGYTNDELFAHLREQKEDPKAKTPAPIGNKPVGNRGQKLTDEEIKTALFYQLHERMQFVKPPDVAVGGLLLELGILVGNESTGPGGSTGIFDLAKKYLRELPEEHPLAREAVVLGELANRGQRFPIVNKSHSTSSMLIFFFVVVPGVALLIIYLKRRIES
jgi:tetratricopeptide (TPR) repeat protein